MKLKNLLPFTLMIWPYLIIPLFLDIFDSKTGSFYFIAYVLLTVLVYLGNIIFACFQRDFHDLAFWNMVLKLAHIPFYLAVFVFGIAAMILIPLLFIIDALLMLTTSAYGIKAMVCANQQRRISIEKTVILIIGHLFFVADVICAIVTYFLSRKHKEESL